MKSIKKSRYQADLTTNTNYLLEPIHLTRSIGLNPYYVARVLHYEIEKNRFQSPQSGIKIIINCPRMKTEYHF